MTEPSGEARPPRTWDRRGFLRSATLATAAPILTTAAGLAAAAPLPPAAAAAGPPGAVARLMAVADQGRDLTWLRSALQIAVELELATIPPYLCAWWSVRDRTSEAATLIADIVHDEMFHMGLACNMLAAVGGTPRIYDAVPAYPSGLPGGVREGLTVYLGGLTRPYVQDVLMGIETPESPLVRAGAAPTIGAFYTALLEVFQGLAPVLSPDRQLGTRIGSNTLRPVLGPADVEEAIDTIKEQGEGSSVSPEPPHGGHGAPSHYYAFGEIFHGARIREAGGRFEYTGDVLPFPEARPMGTVPAGGWPDPSPEVRRLLGRFDATFSRALRALQSAWTRGSARALSAAVEEMRALEGPAVRLMEIPLPDGSGLTYGPQFRPIT
ncbi:ferritin-like protein [Kitasatospora sp. NBC_01539]|uniref:ferritin-like domain-containing protein n=1 Tax=Kitasatospora sp. NBC_01539 TaxID=2903577 RepID=UPI0038601D49